MRTSFLISILLLAGCTFVQLSDAGAGVAQLGSGDVANCESKGVVSTQTRAKVVVSRSEEAVREELTVMARNEAAKLGANAIVPIARPEDGAQSFRAFLCK
ncbi:MAG: DUF4156 domain-containing protein [Pseudomonadaceae bacterium]|nr:DUF4156 domain-containing protein [Pseudomonadaceae bacterium]